MDRRAFLKQGVLGLGALIGGGIEAKLVWAKAPPKRHRTHPLPPLSAADHQLLMLYLMQNINTYAPRYSPNDTEVGRKWLDVVAAHAPSPKVREAARNTTVVLNAVSHSQPLSGKARGAFDQVNQTLEKAFTPFEVGFALDRLSKTPSLLAIPAISYGLSSSRELFQLGEKSIYSTETDPYGYYNHVISLARKRGQLKGKQRGSKEKATKDRIAGTIIKTDIAGAILGALEAGAEWGLDNAVGNGSGTITVGTTTAALPPPDRRAEIEKHAVAGGITASAGVLIYKALKLTSSDTGS
jgi:hypothetical protein